MCGGAPDALTHRSTPHIKLVAWAAAFANRRGRPKASQSKATPSRDAPPTRAMRSLQLESARTRARRPDGARSLPCFTRQRNCAWILQGGPFEDSVVLVAGPAMHSVALRCGGSVRMAQQLTARRLCESSQRYCSLHRATSSRSSSTRQPCRSSRRTDASPTSGGGDRWAEGPDNWVKDPPETTTLSGARAADGVHVSARYA